MNRKNNLKKQKRQTRQIKKREQKRQVREVIRSLFSTIDIYANKELTEGQKRFVERFLDSSVQEKSAGKYAEALIRYVDPSLDIYRSKIPQKISVVVELLVDDEYLSKS